LFYSPNLDESVFGVKLLFTFYGALDFMQKANLMIAGSLGFLVLGLGLVGCSSPKDASKENFAKVISQKIAKEPHKPPNNNVDCSIDVGVLGTETREAEKQEALVKLGFLSSRTVREAIPPQALSLGSSAQKIYELADKGKPIAHQSTDMTGSKNYSLRYCKVAFKEILSYTEPSDGMGVKYSKVKYAYTLVDFPDWVKDEALLNLSGSAKSAVDLAGKTLTAEQSLVLTNEGWSTDLPG
jgi:hypothetical protein